MRAEIATPEEDLQGRVEDGPVLSRRTPRFFISRRFGCGRLCRHLILHWQKKRSLDLMVLDGLVSTQSKYWTVQYSNTRWPVCGHCGRLRSFARAMASAWSSVVDREKTGICSQSRELEVYA